MQKVLASVLGGPQIFRSSPTTDPAGACVRVATPCSVTFPAAYQFFSIELGLSFVAISNLRDAFPMVMFAVYRFCDHAMNSLIKAINAADISVWFFTAPP
jgi:hypothetical protein